MLVAPIPLPVGGPDVWSQPVAFPTRIVLKNLEEPFIGILGLLLLLLLLLLELPLGASLKGKPYKFY